MVLRVDVDQTRREIRDMFDKCGDAERFKRLTKAYEMIMESRGQK